MKVKRLNPSGMLVPDLPDSERQAVVSFWGVEAIVKEHNLDISGIEQKLDLTWADGMIGVLPVFESNKAARKYAGKNIGTFELGLKGKN